jgi:hypothetical protein
VKAKVKAKVNTKRARLLAFLMFDDSKETHMIPKPCLQSQNLCSLPTSQSHSKTSFPQAPIFIFGKKGLAGTCVMHVSDAMRSPILLPKISTRRDLELPDSWWNEQTAAHSAAHVAKGLEAAGLWKELAETACCFMRYRRRT